MSIDYSRIQPTPLHEVAILINNFIITSTKFLNDFSHTVEKKISNVSSKVTELEMLLAVLEAKLNSIPHLESAPPQPHQSASISEPQTQSAAQTNISPEPSAAPSAPSTPSTPQITASNHPDYAPFMKMLKVGVPSPVVANKLSAAGLDPAAADNPDMIIGGGGEGGSSSSPPSAGPASAPLPMATPSAPQMTASQHPDYAPFIKMLKVGVPPPVVANKLAAAGLDPAAASNPEMVIGGGGGGGSTVPAQTAAPEPTLSPSTSSSSSGGLPASQHPDYAPFIKMLKVGVPPPVVANKLSASGLDPSVADNPEKIVPN